MWFFILHLILHPFHPSSSVLHPSSFQRRGGYFLVTRTGEKIHGSDLGVYLPMIVEAMHEATCDVATTPLDGS